MQPSHLYDGINRSLAETTKLVGATSPQAENAAPQKCEADFCSDVAYSVGVRLSAFFVDLGCELFHNARCWWLKTARASKNQCVETAVFRFADSLLVLVSLDALVTFVCIFYGLRAALRMRAKIFTSKKVRLKQEPHRPFALMSSRASSSVVVELLEKTSPSSDWNFGSIWTSWQT